MTTTAYKAKTITGAERRVRELQKQLDCIKATLEQYAKDRTMLAKLAATGPTFFNPLDVADAERVRDAILNRLGMRPDGKFL